VLIVKVGATVASACTDPGSEAELVAEVEAEAEAEAEKQ